MVNSNGSSPAAPSPSVERARTSIPAPKGSPTAPASRIAQPKGRIPRVASKASLTSTPLKPSAVRTASTPSSSSSTARTSAAAGEQSTPTPAAAVRRQLAAHAVTPPSRSQPASTSASAPPSGHRRTTNGSRSIDKTELRKLQPGASSATAAGNETASSSSRAPQSQSREQSAPARQPSEPPANERDAATVTPPHTDSSSSRVLELEEQLKDLQFQFRLLQTAHSRCQPRVERPPRSAARIDASTDKLSILLQDHDALGHIVRGMHKDQRIGLLATVVEACKPSDIQAQIDLLERYKEHRTGVLARLDDQLCIRVIRFLDRQSILTLRLAAKRFDHLSTQPAVWKPLCRELEAAWDGTIELSNYHLDDDGDWFNLYKKLWQREMHWTNGLAQSLCVLGGHTSYVTSLKLFGETLISGSYDDTIRIWNLPFAVSSAKSVPPPQVISAKSVSSLDYYPPEQVLVTGSHDIGRACVWRQIDGEWKVEKILSGHLHGTRGVAINAHWLITVGSDKAIVVWDWRTGNKVVRFGQQTNVNCGMNLLDNHIITATVDGVIRTFSIDKREMLVQVRLSDLAKRQPEFAAKLKDVGVGALGMLTWFEAEGRFMACATKDIVIRLAWDWADAEAAEEGIVPDLCSPTRASTEGPSFPPVSATPTQARRQGSMSHSPRASSPRSPATPRMPSPVVKSSPSSAPSSKLSITAAFEGSDEDHTIKQTTTASQYALGKWPRIVEILDISGTERGAFEAGRVRIVTSRRVSARAGAERRVIVGTEHASADGSHPTMQLVPLGGAWETQGRKVDLHTAAKNPMSLVLDHDKLVYGCSDGSIVVARFVGAAGKPSKAARVVKAG